MSSQPHKDIPRNTLYPRGSETQAQPRLIPVCRSDPNQINLTIKFITSWVATHASPAASSRGVLDIGNHIDDESRYINNHRCMLQTFDIFLLNLCNYRFWIDSTASGNDSLLVSYSESPFNQ